MFNGKVLPNATNATLMVDRVLPRDAGTYTLRVRTEMGEATSDAAELKVVGTFPYTVSTFAGSGTKATLDGVGKASLPYTRPLVVSGTAPLLFRSFLDTAGVSEIVPVNVEKLASPTITTVGTDLTITPTQNGSIKSVRR